MKTIVWSWFVVFVMIYVAKLPMAWAQKQAGFDNKHPRLQQQQLPGLGHRSLAAHQNSFEALIVFSAALSAALWGGGDPASVSTWALVFAACRVAYVPLYWANIDVVRTIAWLISMAAIVRLFVFVL